MASSDLTVIRNSMENFEPSNNVLQKYFLEIPDSNSEVYGASQIRLQTSQLTSSPDWFSGRESELLIPYVHKVSSKNAAGADLSIGATGVELMTTLKNSVLDIINSLSVKMNGKLVVEPCDLTNTYLNFMLCATTSKDALSLLENQMMFALNDGEMVYKGAASSNGIGECNNNIYKVKKTVDADVADADAQVEVGQVLSKILGNYDQNTGYLKRASVTGFNPVEDVETNNNLYINANNCVATRTSHFVHTSDSVKYYHMFIRIPLNQFDFFKKYH